MLALTPFVGTSRQAITHSLRLRANAGAHMTRVVVAPTLATRCTVSFWVKRGNPATGAFQTLYGGANTASQQDTLGFGTTNGVGDHLELRDSGAGIYNLRSNAVFRDPTAHGHVVVQIDTAQATPAERVKLYWNGEQLTSLAVATYPAQNYVFDWQAAGRSVAFGQRHAGSGSFHFDGLISDFIQVDGQALTPASFGQFDTGTGAWVPRRYAGTYGNNGFHLPFADASRTRTNELTNSENFAAKTLTRFLAFGSGSVSDATTDPRGTATADLLVPDTNNNEHWVGGPVSMVANAYTYSIYAKAAGYDFIAMQATLANPAGAYGMFDLRNGTAAAVGAATVGIRDCGNGWYRCWVTTTHVGASPETYRTMVQSAAGQFGAFAANGTSGVFLWGEQMEIGPAPTAYLATAGSAVTGTTLGDSATGYNSWITSGIGIAAGATFDQLIDTPTNNYCTLNPLFPPGGASPSYSEANLLVNFPGAGVGGAVGTIAMEAGDFYWEVECLVAASGNNFAPGVASVTATPGGAAGWTDSAGFWGYISGTGNRISGGVSSSYGATFAAGDVIGVRFNRAAGELSFSKNGAAQGVAFTGLTAGAYVPAFNDGTAVAPKSYRVNFGQRPFAYAPPAGALPLCTRNLPAPPIRRGDDAFHAGTRIGTGTTASVSSLRFAPDLLWIKSRAAATDHALYDTVRSVRARLESNNSDAEVAADSGVISFLPGGFTVDTLAQVNTSGATYVDWGWRRGTSFGFDVQGYTGNGVAGRTVAHNLGAPPHFIVQKNRQNTTSWCVYHRNMAAVPQNGAMLLNSAGAYFGDATVWNNTAPTSSNFTVGSSANTNQNGAPIVAYLWTEIPGFSRFGSYVGNGSADGPFVWCGFRPRWLLVKGATVATSWYLVDAARNASNVATAHVYPNVGIVEDINGGRGFDLTAGGFKIRQESGYGANNAGETYVFAAFAETPFKSATAR